MKAWPGESKTLLQPESFGGVSMDNMKMKIGEMARMSKVSIPTLRLYDEMGLLTPCYTDPETKYRYYSIYQPARLDMIVSP